MSDQDEEVRAAALRFYAALEDMVDGRGLEAMRTVWHHTDRVTTGHPSGEIAQGWDEVWATWNIFAQFGKKGRGGTRVRNLLVCRYGDFAYTTCVFDSSPAFGGDSLSCTNVLTREGGVWKLVHHHADKSPAMGAALEKLASEGD